MDRGIWATWYNLPEENREDYFAWLHEVHLPAALERPGVLWAAHYQSEEKISRKFGEVRLSRTEDSSVPTGDRFILLFGGETAHTFFNPTPGELRAKQTPQAAEMLGRRIGERSNIFTEESRVDGPEVARRGPGMTGGPCIQMGSFNHSGTVEEEDDMGAWYAQWRMPCMGKMPGCIGVRKLVSASGWAKHSIFYEYVSLEERNKNFVEREANRPEMEEWSKMVIRRLVHAPGSSNVGKRLWPPV